MEQLQILEQVSSGQTVVAGQGQIPVINSGVYNHADLSIVAMIVNFLRLGAPTVQILAICDCEDMSKYIGDQCRCTEQILNDLAVNEKFECTVKSDRVIECLRRKVKKQSSSL